MIIGTAGEEIQVGDEVVLDPITGKIFKRKPEDEEPKTEAEIAKEKDIKVLFKLVINVEDDTENLRLTQQGGDGVYGSHKVNVCNVIGLGSLIVSFRGRRLMIDNHEIVPMICEAYDKLIGEDDEHSSK